MLFVYPRWRLSYSSVVLLDAHFTEMNIFILVEIKSKCTRPVIWQHPASSSSRKLGRCVHICELFRNLVNDICKALF